MTTAFLTMVFVCIFVGIAAITVLAVIWRIVSNLQSKIESRDRTIADWQRAHEEGCRHRAELADAIMGERRLHNTIVSEVRGAAGHRCLTKETMNAADMVTKFIEQYGEQ